MMRDATDTESAPWHIVRFDDKERARLNCISHLLRIIPFKRAPTEKIKLPKVSGVLVAEQLGKSDCAHNARVIVEKPFGTESWFRARQTRFCSERLTRRRFSASTTTLASARSTAMFY